MGWLNSVEFYVVAGSVAAAVVALSALPSRRGAAVLHLAAGELLPPDDSDNPESPAISAEVDRHGRVVVTRHGLHGITSDGAVSLAINVIGFDVKIEERLTPGSAAGTPIGQTRFTLDFFAPERYHISYNSEDAGLFAAFTLPIRPGIAITRPLR